MPADPASFAVGLLTMLAAGLLYQLGVASQISGEPGPDLESWRRWRRRYRMGVTLTIAGIGGCALAAGMIGPGKTWVLLWGATAPLLTITLVIALLDAAQTRRFYNGRLPEIRRKHMAPNEGPHEKKSRDNDSSLTD